jgi:photosystem II stability/assembly factor-like uncharacterized protein
MDPAFMLAGAEDAVYRSRDAGKTWTRCDGPEGSVLGFNFDRTQEGGSLAFAATIKGIWRTEDGGSTWADATGDLPSKSVTSFAGGSNPKTKVHILYCTLPRRVTDNKTDTGTYRSLDRGETWQAVTGEGLNLETKAFDEWAMGPVANYYRLVTSDANPERVYAFNSNTGIPPPHHTSAYRSDDAGRTWRPNFQGDPRFPPVNVEPDYITTNDGQYYQEVPLGVAGNPNDPNFLMTVDSGRVYVTRDGGDTWTRGHTRTAQGASPSDNRWVCNGLVVTSTWNYAIDPFDPKRHFICYTDIGFARSTDAGATWSWWTLKGRPPWTNTTYDLAFDPAVPGKVWGAFSNVHDIPNGNIIWGNHNPNGPGGVCVSTDHGATWTPSNTGLPVAPATSVVVDPRSPKDARVLYAGVFGKGVYRSADGGKTWEDRNRGLGSEENRRVCRVQLHRDGTLFALITGLRKEGKFQSDGVGLYRSRNGGQDWELVNRSQPLLWPKDFTVDPSDSRVLYLGAANVTGQEQSGLYRSVDGGATWKLLARKGSEHFGAYLSPFHKGWIYMTLTEGAPGAGLWLSKNNGASWSPAKGLPFSNVQRVAFDPKRPELVYVTTFGGSVWKGPASF